jgi:hypothetical protein
MPSRSLGSSVWLEEEARADLWWGGRSALLPASRSRARTTATAPDSAAYTISITSMAKSVKMMGIMPCGLVLKGTCSSSSPDM